MTPDAVFARGEAEADRMTAEYVNRAQARQRLLAGAISRSRIAMAERKTPKQLMVEVLGAGRR